MKILKTEDEVLRIYLEDDAVCLQFDDYVTSLTPLEAQLLATTLAEISNETRYFKGLRAST